MLARRGESGSVGVVLVSLFLSLLSAACLPAASVAPSSEDASLSHGDRCVHFEGEQAVSVAWAPNGDWLASSWITTQAGGGVVRVTAWPSLDTVELDRGPTTAASSGVAAGPGGTARWLREVDGRGEIWEGGPQREASMWRRLASADYYGLSWSAGGVYAWQEQSPGARVVKLGTDSQEQTFSSDHYFTEFWIEPDASWFVAEVRPEPGGPVEFVVEGPGRTWHLFPTGSLLGGPSMDPTHTSVMYEDHDAGSIVSLELDGRTSRILRPVETGPYRVSANLVAAYVADSSGQVLCFRAGT